MKLLSSEVLEGMEQAVFSSPLVPSRAGRRTLLCGRLWHTAAGLDPLDVSGITSNPNQDNKNIFRFHQTSRGKKTLLNSVRAITKIARGSACNLYKLFDGHVEFAVLWLAFRSCSNTSSPFERGLAYVYEVCGGGECIHGGQRQASGDHLYTSFL